MPNANLLLLIDDIATLLDDVAVLSGTAARKTAGVLGDDLALNAQQVTGVEPNRELPVVWSVAKGSALNKLILVPVALLLSWLAPWAVVPLLIFGGIFLCFEGAEKLAHRWLGSHEDHTAHHRELLSAVKSDPATLLAFEKEKISGAIRTDFILSAEIVAITLGIVSSEPFLTRVLVLFGISVLMTAGVYGLVAGIVKLDDLGRYLHSKEGRGTGAAMQRRIGVIILFAAPWLMKILSVCGTAAMFLVGGGILTHGLHFAHELSQRFAEMAAGIPIGSKVLEALAPSLFDGAFGIVAGGLALLAVSAFKKIFARTPKSLS